MATMWQVLLSNWQLQVMFFSEPAGSGDVTPTVSNVQEVGLNFQLVASIVLAICWRASTEIQAHQTITCCSQHF
jgi:hypothetical protein